jgi:hypothetical protein
MKLTLARDWVNPMEPWLIPGFLIGTRTLLSGEPKIGKTMLAQHLVSSLIQQTPFLGSQPIEGFHNVAWMGFDVSWQAEYKHKFPFHQDFVYFTESIHFDEEREWGELEELLVQSHCSLLVVDHLYGLAGSLDLDESHEMLRALSPLLLLQERTSIPILLISHAGKSGTGRAAHSTLLEAQFRHLLRLTGSTRNNRRDIVSMGNLCGSTKYSVEMNLRGVYLRGSSVETESLRIRERTEISLNKAKRFLAEAPSEAKKNFSAAGRWFAESGESDSEEGGRTLARKLVKQELLASPTENHPYIRAGAKLLV